MPRSGLAGAVTLTPRRFRRSITPLQLDPSANAPCTSTTVGVSVWLSSDMSDPSRFESPQRAERVSHLAAEQLWLFPGGEMAAPVELVEVDEVVRVGLLRPTARPLIELVREEADRERYRYRLGVGEGRLFFS